MVNTREKKLTIKEVYENLKYDMRVIPEVMMLCVHKGISDGI